MSDRREAILARLVDVAAIAGVSHVSRNQIGVDDLALPAIIILDGDETPVLDPAGRPRGPRLVRMHAEAHILVNGDYETIGSVMNAFRAALIKAVLEDATLATLVGSNGDIAPGGCSVSFAEGNQLEGEMAIAFAFTYPLILSEI
ncbi:MAG: hypothetical protein K2Y29_00425 [Beijerinckiaceae bacterium]|nr:hypothetical protein [Beijerinckiaceae bacterium]